MNTMPHDRLATRGADTGGSRAPGSEPLQQTGLVDDKATSDGGTVVSPTGPPTGPHIGLALGSGAARGWAHIGVVRALEELDYSPAIVTGTSIGALVGGFLVSGRLDALEDWARRLTKLRMVRYLDFRLRSNGLLGGHRLASEMARHLGDARIEAFAQRFASVVTDLATGEEIWLTEGRLADAVRAGQRGAVMSASAQPVASGIAPLAGFAQSSLLVVLDPTSSSEDMARSMYGAVERAYRDNAQVTFRLVAVAAGDTTEGATLANARAVRAQAGKAMEALQTIGVPASRVNMEVMTDPDLATNEIRLLQN